MLPIDIQMQIDIMAADAKRAVSEGFAAARERLLPEPAPDPQRAYMLAMQQGLAADPRGDWVRYNDLAAQQNVWMSGNSNHPDWLGNAFSGLFVNPPLPANAAPRSPPVVQSAPLCMPPRPPRP